jgi:hypothetical protein
MVCLLLNSCGGGSSSSNTPFSLITSGNWSMAATSSASKTKLDIGGSLVQSGANVAATVHIANSSCFNYVADDVQLAGAFTDNTVTLTSLPVNGQIVTLVLAGVGNNLSGTYSIAGGCANGDHGTITAVYAAPVTGTWTATFTDGSSSVNAVATLTQAASADAHGRFPLTGSISFSGSPCSTGGNIITSNSSAVWGDITSAVITTNDVGGGQGALNYVGVVADPTNPVNMSGDSTVTAGICSGNFSFLQFSKK